MPPREEKWLTLRVITGSVVAFGVTLSRTERAVPPTSASQSPSGVPVSAARGAEPAAATPAFSVLEESDASSEGLLVLARTPNQVRKKKHDERCAKYHPNAPFGYDIVGGNDAMRRNLAAAAGCESSGSDSGIGLCCRGPADLEAYMTLAATPAGPAPGRAVQRERQAQLDERCAVKGNRSVGYRYWGIDNPMVLHRAAIAAGCTSLPAVRSALYCCPDVGDPVR